MYYIYIVIYIYLYVYTIHIFTPYICCRPEAMFAAVSACWKALGASRDAGGLFFLAKWLMGVFVLYGSMGRFHGELDIR